MSEPFDDLSVTGDVVESAPPPRRPVLTRVTVIVAAVLTVGALLVLRSNHEKSSFDPMPMVSGPSSGVVVPLPDHIATDALVPGIDLGTFVAPTNPPVLVDTTTRTRRTIPALPNGSADSFFDVTDLGGGRFVIVAWYVPGARARAFLVTGATATLVATGDAVVVGADGASVLVSRGNGTAGQNVQRYDLAGHEVGGPVPIGPDEILEAETVAGLVIGGSTNLRQLLDPVTGAARSEIDEPMAINAHALAHVLTDGRLAIDSLAGGNAAASTFVYPRLPGTGLVYRALFSPDARYLAVDLIGAYPIDHTLLVLDRMTGAWSVLPGTPIRPLDGQPLAMAWGGDVLVVASGEGAVALWHPGDSVVYAAPAPQNSAS